MDEKYKNFIQNEIENNNIVLFMKGSPEFPACGFSSIVVSILRSLNVKFRSHNVLEDAQLRQTIKDFSDWPTIPQLYVDGEFIGGCDIIRELFETGELAKIIHTK